MESIHPELSPTELLVLEEISASAGTTRAAIAEKLALSSTRVSVVVRSLLDGGFVTERAESNAGARRPRKLLFSLEQVAPFWLAEVGSTHARLGLADISGSVFATREVAISLSDGPQKVLRQLIEELNLLAVENGKPDHSSMVGLALPGPVDQGKNGVSGAARMMGWNNHDLKAIVQGHIEAEVILENDARAGAIGELVARKLEDSAVDAIYVKAGTGIGAAAILGGELYVGSAGFAGDIAHNPVPAGETRSCNCGRVGCLETVASGAAIIKELSENGSDIHSNKELVHSAEQYDPHVATLVRNGGSYLGRVLAPLVNFLNPQMLIIGGALSKLDAFMAGVQSEVYAHSLSISSRNLDIEQSITKEDAAILGMAHRCAAHMNLTAAGDLPRN